jgi:hypothetical protein
MIHHEAFLIHHPPWCIINHLELIIRKQSGWGSMLLFEREPSYVFRPIIPLPTEHVAQIAIFFGWGFFMIFHDLGLPNFQTTPDICCWHPGCRCPKMFGLCPMSFLIPFFFDIQEVHV